MLGLPVGLTGVGAAGLAAFSLYRRKSDIKEAVASAVGKVKGRFADDDE